MKTAKQWQEELAGETSIQSIKAIQTDALLHASQILAPENETSTSIYARGRAECRRIILDEIGVLNLNS